MPHPSTLQQWIVERRPDKPDAIFILRQNHIISTTDMSKFIVNIWRPRFKIQADQRVDADMPHLTCITRA